MEKLFEEIEKYQKLSPECKREFSALVVPKFIAKNDFFLRQGAVPDTYAFITKGLFSYYHSADNGDDVIKKFFGEYSFMASTSALLQQQPSHFSICALENSEILIYPNKEFRQLMEKYHELTLFQLKYLEINWVIAKENLEISLKYETAKQRYSTFRTEYHTIEPRLKQHQIASYLGITPTQLSRIRRDLEKS